MFLPRSHCNMFFSSDVSLPEKEKPQNLLGALLRHGSDMAYSSGFFCHRSSKLIIPYNILLLEYEQIYLGNLFGALNGMFWWNIQNFKFEILSTSLSRNAQCWAFRTYCICLRFSVLLCHFVYFLLLQRHSYALMTTWFLLINIFVGFFAQWL